MRFLSTTYASVLCIAISSATINHAVADKAPTDRQLSLDGTTIHYTEAGSGDTIVAVHGAVSDKRVWNAYQQPLSEAHHFVSYTRRYYGTQPWPPGEHIYDASVHAADLTSLIRSLDAGPVHLLARSSGAYSAVITAVKHPELVRSLVLWEPFVGNDFVPSAGFDEKSVEMISAFGKGFGPAAKAAKSNDHQTAIVKFIEHVYELGSGGFEKLPEDLKEMFNDNARTLSLLYSGKTTDKVTCDFLGQVKAPALILRGGNTDSGYALTHVKAAECIPGSELRVVDGVVHDGAGKKVSEISGLAVDFWSKQK